MKLQVEQAAAEVLECSEAWRKGSATAKPASSILRLLGALDELPAAAMLNAAHATEGQPALSADATPGTWPLPLHIVLLLGSLHKPASHHTYHPPLLVFTA